ncbi:hypothetical protein PFISCL1PPCAC_8823, partial [Pristionchus fissidentatus]
WLRHEKIQAIFKSEFLQSFMIDDQLYVTSATIFQPWTLHSIDTQNFSIKEVAVTYHTGFNVHNHPVLVHNNCAFVWNDVAIIKGIVESHYFHWMVVDSASAAPEDGLSQTQLCYTTEGDAPKYGVLLAEYVRVENEDPFEEMYVDEFVVARDRAMYLCELDLNTMEWTHRPVPMNEKAFEIMCGDNAASAHSSRGNIHLNSVACGLSSDQHLALDLSTLAWSIESEAEENQPYHKFFVAKDELYKIGRLKRGKNMMIFKYLEAENEWIKVHDCSSFLGNSAKDLTLCTTGSRIFIFDAKKRTGGRCISVLELDPSLFDHSMALLLRNDNNREVASKSLPPHLSCQMIRDSSGDSQLNIIDSEDRYNSFIREAQIAMASAEFREAMRGLVANEPENPERENRDQV